MFEEQMEGHIEEPIDHRKLTILEIEQMSSAILQGLDGIDMHSSDDNIVLASIQESIIDYLRNAKDRLKSTT